MPAEQATRFTCPECGANLPVAGDDVAAATCTYCGTAARLQRRTRVMQLPVKLPPPKADEPPRVARAKREWTVTSIAANVMSALLSFAIAGGIGFTLYMDWHRDHSMRWRDDNPPRLVELDGDGVDDIVGIGAYDDVPQIVALSGRDGHELWHVALDAKHGGSTLVLAGDKLIAVDGRGTLAAFDHHGAPAWRATLPDETRDFCRADTPDAFVVTLPSGSGAVRVTIATGAVQPFARPHGWDCAYLPGARTDLDDAGSTYLPNGQITSTTLSMQAAYAHGSGPIVLAGSHAGGRAVPRLAAVDAKDHVLWEHDVADGSPLDVQTGEARPIAVSDDAIATIYERLAPARSTHLAAFDRATGARRFDIEADLGKLAMTTDTIFLSRSGCLRTYDARSGATRWSFDCSSY